jgi:hypothetical protein
MLIQIVGVGQDHNFSLCRSLVRFELPRNEADENDGETVNSERLSVLCF